MLKTRVAGPDAVAVLCARRDSIYKTFPQCDVFDADRDARSFAGGMPVIAHPPCRLWGRLAYFARAENPEKEKALGIWCVKQVREWGGVLEHPFGSRLWDSAGMAKPGRGSFDRFGGWTLAVPQIWFGHRAVKPSWLYIVGVTPAGIPKIPLSFDLPTRHIAWSRSQLHRLPHMSHADRERTPPALARWLVDLAGRCGNSLKNGALA
jgi:hypothetical protein